MKNNTFTKHGANPGVQPRIDILIGSLLIHILSINIIKRLINIIPLLDLMYYLKTGLLSTVFFFYFISLHLFLPVY